VKHVAGDGGWCEWVNPRHESYHMICCDCGLDHEMQFKVLKFAGPAKRVGEVVEDENYQAIFRARRASKGEL
jgi:hypothetical protein